MTIDVKGEEFCVIAIRIGLPVELEQYIFLLHLSLNRLVEFVVLADFLFIASGRMIVPIVIDEEHCVFLDGSFSTGELDLSLISTSLMP